MVPISSTQKIPNSILKMVQVLTAKKMMCWGAKCEEWTQSQTGAWNLMLWCMWGQNGFSEVRAWALKSREERVNYKPCSRNENLATHTKLSPLQLLAWWNEDKENLSIGPGWPLKLWELLLGANNTLHLLCTFQNAFMIIILFLLSKQLWCIVVFLLYR